jgi:uncharacterized membrane protein YGL010W
MARTLQQWFDAYGESHQNPTNKAIHWVCVPAIYFCVVALLYSIPMPAALPTGAAALLALLLVMVFYFRLSLTMGIAMTLFSLACLWLSQWLHGHAPWPLWAIALVVFALAWVGQFYGHKVEGRKPSFLHDVQFLLIGPAWLMGFLFRRAGLAY